MWFSKEKPEPTRPAQPAGTIMVAGDEPGKLREYGMPEIVQAKANLNAPWLFFRRLHENPRQVVIERKSYLGNFWQKVTAQAFADDIYAVARGLITLGIEPGDSISIMAHTSYEWSLLDFAILSVGAVTVPIYETSSAEQIEWVISDAGVKMVFTESTSQGELVRTIAKKNNWDVKVYVLAQEGISEVTHAGRDGDNDLVDQRLDQVNLESLATIIYTSGTTGRPKGVELTHGNIVRLVLNGLEWMPEIANHAHSRLLLFLPLAHGYARLLQFFQLAGPGILGHTGSIKTLLDDLASFKPTYLLTVPRVLEKVYNAADAKAGSGLKLRTFRYATKVAIEYSRAQDSAHGPKRGLKLAHSLFERIIYAKLRALLGGKAEFAISGGAPLGDRLSHFYRGLGLTVLEGYGLTETFAPVCVNTARLSKLGTVGQPVPGNTVRIGADGEIQVKGINVFRGYHNAPDLTAQAFDDGWFKSGDIGWIDKDGYVHITGRTKEILVTAGGKNVVPAIMEDSMRGHPLISQVMVIGDRRPFISALITLDAEMLPGWLRNHGLPTMDITEAATNPQVLAALNRAVERANRHVSRAESVRKIKVLTTDFTESNGMLTPSMKVKRNVVMKHFEDEINEIYGGPLTDI